MQINNNSISPELIAKARELASDSKGFDAVKFQELKTIALKDGKLSKEEATFIANLDNQSVLNKILSSKFNPQSFSFEVDKKDNTLTLSNNVKFSVGEGKSVFKNGKIDTKSLADINQRDKDDNTIGDNARCSCNATVVGLAIQGKDKLTDAMSKTLGKYIKDNVSKKDTPEYLQTIGTLSKLISDTQNGNLTQQDINTFASVLYDMYDTDKSDNIMKYDDVGKMQKDLGFSSGKVNVNLGDKVGNIAYGLNGDFKTDLDISSKSFKDAQKNLSKQVIDNIKNGETVTLSVFNGNGTDKPNHFLLVGKDENGKLFIYNSDPLKSEKTKTYLEGDKAKDFLATKLAISYENQKTSRTLDEYELKVVAPVIK
ncbi:MAG: hypothetical protein U0354_01810 [Candidatus Sericytochromatia bacterium]